MKKYKFLQHKRRNKQFFMSLIFIAVLILGWHYPLLGYFIPLCMLFGIGMGFLRGRKWCDWYCPRGSFYDALASAISPKRKIPGLFKNIFFRIGVTLLLMSIMTYNLLKRWPDPYKMGMFFIILVTITTLVGIVLAVIYHQRAWCLICPVGTIVNLIGRNRENLKIDPDRCVECRLCAKSCPVQIKPYIFKNESTHLVRDGDCLKCGICISICPKKALAENNA